MPNHQRMFTIGHSVHEINDFIKLLKKHKVDCLIDVRSQPYSRIAPRLNKERLSSALKSAEILYTHLENAFRVPYKHLFRSFTRC